MRFDRRVGVRRIGSKSYGRRLRIESLEARRMLALLTVTNLNDSGAGSLRQAMLQADANTGSDDIVFDQALAGGTISLASPLPQIIDAEPLTITGPGSNASGVIIDGNDTFRIILITGGGATITLRNMTIRDGNAGGGADGGGIRNFGALTMERVNVLSCIAGDEGGGVYSNGASLVMRDCVASGNSATNGGGVHVTTTATIERSTISGNTTTQFGGGIQNLGGTLQLRNSTISANVAGASGGGLDSSGASATTNVRGTTFSGNAATGFGGGIANRNSSVLNLAASTIYGNEAAGNGGGLSLTTGVVNVNNSTFAYNVSRLGSGGALATTAGTINAANVTIVGNVDTSGGASSAGGIAKVGGGTLNLSNSIVSRNFAAAGAADDNVALAGIDTNNDNFIGGNPQLGPLQDNGGPTLTMAPLPTSPVIDAGTNAFVSQETDQRGFRRIVDGNLNSTATVDQGAVEFNPGPSNPIVTGTDQGGQPIVKVFDHDGALVRSFFAYGATFFGGVRVAVGDVNNDGIDDIITAPGPGGGPHVKAFHGATGALLHNFFAYGAGFTGGVFVASGDVNNDGFDDIITGAGAGGGPHVKVFSGNTGAELASFFAYGAGFTGGVHVASGHINNDGNDDIITGPGAGGGPNVRVFSGANTAVMLQNFFAYDASFTGGVWVGSGDINGDDFDDVITGPGAGGGPHVKVFNGLSLAIIAQAFVYSSNFTGGVRVSATDRNGDGRDDILTIAGPTGGAHVRAIDGLTLADIDNFFAYDPQFLGGAFIGG